MNLKNKNIIKGFVINGDGTPIGSVLPDFVGQLYKNQDSQKMYMAVSIDIFGWKCITGESELPPKPDVFPEYPEIYYYLAEGKVQDGENPYYLVAKKDCGCYYYIQFKERGDVKC